MNNDSELQSGASLPASAGSAILEICAEVNRATAKFPTWPTDALHAVGVVAEEMGELQKEVMQLTYEPHKSTKESVRKEAVQLAAVSLRFLMSLDRYEYQPRPQHSQNFYYTTTGSFIRETISPELALRKSLIINKTTPELNEPAVRISKPSFWGAFSQSLGQLLSHLIVPRSLHIMNPQHAIQRLREVIRRQHKALSTENSYVYWLRLYTRALRRMPESLSSEQKLERFLTHLACRRDVSASTQNQAFNAILFFYKEVLHQPLQNVDALRAKRPLHLRHAPTLPETQTLLGSIPDVAGYPTNLIARLLYGCGLRVAEPLNLRIKDVSLHRSTLALRGAKGGKDRLVHLPHSLLPEFTQQLQFARTIWQRDVRNRLPVMLPHRLARKYPAYQFIWPWAWLFPAHHPCRDPRTGSQVRYRMHEANVQRAIRAACRQLGLAILPHELRHGYATHCLEHGVNPRAIQQVMGHQSLETTMGYLHAESLSVPSPLEQLSAVMLPFEVPPVKGHLLRNFPEATSGVREVEAAIPELGN